MSRNSAASSGSSNTAFTVFIVFLILKLTNVIDWSWWWVTAPLWIGLALALVAAVFLAGVPSFGALLLGVMMLPSKFYDSFRAKQRNTYWDAREQEEREQKAAQTTKGDDTSLSV